MNELTAMNEAMPKNPFNPVFCRKKIRESDDEFLQMNQQKVLPKYPHRMPIRMAAICRPQ